MLHSPGRPLPEKNAHVIPAVGVRQAAGWNCVHGIFRTEIDPDAAVEFLAPLHEVDPDRQMLQEIFGDGRFEQPGAEYHGSEIKLDRCIFHLSYITFFASIFN